MSLTPRFVYKLRLTGYQVLALRQAASVTHVDKRHVQKSDVEFGDSAGVKYLFFCYLLLLPYNIGGRFSSKLSMVAASIIVRYIFHYRYSFTRVIIISHLCPLC